MVPEPGEGPERWRPPQSFDCKMRSDGHPLERYVAVGGVNASSWLARTAVWAVWGSGTRAGSQREGPEATEQPVEGEGAPLEEDVTQGGGSTLVPVTSQAPAVPAAGRVSGTAEGSYTAEGGTHVSVRVPTAGGRMGGEGHCVWPRETIDGPSVSGGADEALLMAVAARSLSGGTECSIPRHCDLASLPSLTTLN